VRTNDVAFFVIDQGMGFIEGFLALKADELIERHIDLLPEEF
jgi:hypothetical protein